MPVPDNFVVTVQGPKGVVHVEIPAGQARLFAAEHDNDEYRAALFLASCDLYHKSLTEVDTDRIV